MFLNTFHGVKMFQNDAVKSYREKIILKTLQLEFNIHQKKGQYGPYLSRVSVLAVFLLSDNFCHLLITLANSLDPDPDRANHISGSKLIDGSAVVECLTQDRGIASSSFTGVTVLCP